MGFPSKTQHTAIYLSQSLVTGTSPSRVCVESQGLFMCLPNTNETHSLYSIDIDLSEIQVAPTKETHLERSSCEAHLHFQIMEADIQHPCAALRTYVYNTPNSFLPPSIALLSKDALCPLTFCKV